MTSAPDVFCLMHGGGIREVPVMPEGEDGRFDLVASGWLGGTVIGGTPSTPVRSRVVTAVRLLLDSGGHDPQHSCRWRPIGGAVLHALQEEPMRVSGANALPALRPRADAALAADPLPDWLPERDTQ